MHIANLASGAGAIFGLLVLVVAALAVGRDRYARTRIESLQGDRDDLTARCDRQDREIAELKAKVEAEETARKVLERTVNARDLMEALRSDLQAHHRAGMDAMQKTYTAIEELTDIVETRRGGAG